MSRKDKGRIGPEDQELWSRVKKTATPLHPISPRIDPLILDKGKQIAPKKKKTESAKFSPKPFRIGQSSVSMPPIQPTQSAVAPKMDAKAYGRLKRGKLKPEARIDLHGMTQDRALPALTSFIQDSAARGLRLVLVITGKGRPRPDFGPIPEQPGILRRNVPGWLRNGANGAHVMEVVTAHKSHGGEGAYYVYLRRRR